MEAASPGVTSLPLPARRRSSKPARLLLLATTASVLTYYALHHGSYSLIDRQTMGILAWVAVGAGAAFGVLPAVRPSRVALVPILALAGLALLHIGAALKHQFFDRDNLVARMLPGSH